MTSSGFLDIFVAKISSTNAGPGGFLLNDTAQNGDTVDVKFMEGNSSGSIFSILKPGINYYIDCKCQLSTCCKCAKKFMGVACDTKTLIYATGQSTCLPK